MATIELELPLTEDRILTVQLPATAKPGDAVVVRLTLAVLTRMDRLPLDLPLHDIGPWSQDLPLRREEM